MIDIETKHALLDLKEEIEMDQITAIGNERAEYKERIRAIKAESGSMYKARKAVLLENMD